MVTSPPILSTAQTDLALWASQNGFGVLAVNIFAGIEPDKQYDPAITFTNVGSEPGVYSYGQRRAILKRPHVRIWARSKVYQQAEDLALRLYEFMDQQNIMINGTYYLYVRTMSEPVPGGHDEANRQCIGFSVRCMRRG